MLLYYKYSEINKIEKETQKLYCPKFYDPLSKMLTLLTKIYHMCAIKLHENKTLQESFVCTYYSYADTDHDTGL